MQDPYPEGLFIRISTGWFTAHGCIRWTIFRPFSATTSSTLCWPFYWGFTSTGLFSFWKCFTSCCSARYVSFFCAYLPLSNCINQFILFCFVFFFQLHSQLDGDDRSDEEEDDTDSQMEQKPTSSHVNGSGLRGRANGHWHQQMTRTERRANGQSNWRFTFEIWAVKSWFQTASAVNAGFKGIVKDYDNCFLKGKIDSVCRVTLSLAK